MVRCSVDVHSEPEEGSRMTEVVPSGTGPGVDPVRAQALRRLKKKRDLAAHVLVFTLVNGFFVIIWAFTSSGFFWPVFPIAGWGIGLIMNAWDVWRGDDFSDAEVAREIARLEHHAQSQSEHRPVGQERDA
jgi:hypothetical protein